MKKLCYVLMLTMLIVLPVCGFALVESADIGITSEVFFPGLSRQTSSVMDDVTVYVSGEPIGISVKVSGLAVVSKGEVMTETGVVSPLKDADIARGDILESIGGIRVSDERSLREALQNGDAKVLTYRRGNEEKSTTVTPVRESLSNDYKIGLTVKEGVTGIGTLTYVTKSGKFGALGHHVIDSDSGLSKEFNSGSIYPCTISNINVGEKGSAGELNGAIDFSSNPIGRVAKNTPFGLFGDYQASTKNMLEVSATDKSNIKAGKAFIYSSVSGSPEFYEIRIIKLTAQSTPAVKSMVLEVVDSELLSRTGGIVQGMSGSPILQNGKLVGAVTHVFLGDPTMGYGVYANWMFNETSD